MVRYSVTMDEVSYGKNRRIVRKTENLASRVDKRSLHHSSHYASPASVRSELTILPTADPLACSIEHNMPDYEEMYKTFRIDVPEYFNFGFDVIDAWANKDRNKLAMIWVNQEGVEKKFTFWDLMRLSNQIVKHPHQIRGQQRVTAS